MIENEFGRDTGTLWTRPRRPPSSLHDIQRQKFWKHKLRKLVNRRPIVWFVDDEQANRRWFAENHCPFYGVITFSSFDLFCDAWTGGTPCDAVVTDIFFPKNPPETVDESQTLMDIYRRIDETTTVGLAGLWEETKKEDKWLLDGFKVAELVISDKPRRRDRIPVFLYSRKATMLLGSDDWTDETPMHENTYWLLEKLNPKKKSIDSEKYARIQRARIDSALRTHQRASFWWLKALVYIGLRLGLFPYSVRDSGGEKGT